MTGRVPNRAICITGIALLAISLPTERAAAEPIAAATITSGSVLVRLTSSDLDLVGTQGFSLHGAWDSTTSLCLPCQVGETQPFSATLAGSLDSGGTGTFQGQTYVFDFNLGGASLNFDAPVLTLPPAPPGNTAQFTLPFSLHASGSLRSFVLFDPGNGAPGFQVPVRGSGTATLSTEIFRNTPEFGPLYVARSLQYNFAAPVPEPGSLILIGTGITAGWWHRQGRLSSRRV